MSAEERRALKEEDWQVLTYAGWKATAPDRQKLLELLVREAIGVEVVEHRPGETWLGPRVAGGHVMVPESCGQMTYSFKARLKPSTGYSMETLALMAEGLRGFGFGEGRLSMEDDREPPLGPARKGVVEFHFVDTKYAVNWEAYHVGDVDQEFRGREP